MQRLISIICLFILLLVPAQAWPQASHVLQALELDLGQDQTVLGLRLDTQAKYSVSSLGQRLVVRLERTRAAAGLEPLSPGRDILSSRIDDLKRSIEVTVLLRRPPSSVETLTAADKSLLQVILNWPEQGRWSRPGIDARPTGELTVIRKGAAEGYYLQSRFSGRWKEFFREYSAPVSPGLELNYCLCPFAFFKPWLVGTVKGKALQAAKHGDWTKVLDLLETGLDQGPGPKRTALAAYALIALDRPGSALERLRPVYRSTGKGSASLPWLAYLYVRALAGTDQPYLGGVEADECQELVGWPKSLEAYWQLLTAELALFTSRPQLALDRLDQTLLAGKRAVWIQAARRLQALSALGRQEEAWQALQETPLPLSFLRRFPASLECLADLVYSRGEYSRAMRLYNALADGLSRGRDKSLVLWRMGSCLRRLDKPQATEEIMALIQDRWPDSAGAYRAALTSNDITVLKDWDKLGPGHVAAYSEIVDQGPTRELRQEAAFKQILVVNQMGRKQRAIECLGDFLDNFGATRLAIQAKVLAGELLPGVVGSLLDRGQIVQGLALVAKYREVLVHTRMPYPFLSQVGSMFEQLGLYERSARVFSYILARSQDPRRRAEILPRMVRLARQQMDPVRVQSYARDYLQEFPEGQKRSQVIAAAAEVLLQTGQAPKALEWLRDSRRPPDRDLDLLTARVLYAAGRYAEMDHYLKRARKSEGPLPARIRNIWAEALFRTRRFELALPVWRSLFADQTFGPRALYRAAEGLSRLGKFNQAAKLYARLDDKKKDSLWKDLAEQGRLINQVQGIMASQE